LALENTSKGAFRPGGTDCLPVRLTNPSEKKGLRVQLKGRRRPGADISGQRNAYVLAVMFLYEPREDDQDRRNFKKRGLKKKLGLGGACGRQE